MNARDGALPMIELPRRNQQQQHCSGACDPKDERSLYSRPAYGAARAGVPISERGLINFGWPGEPCGLRSLIGLFSYIGEESVASTRNRLDKARVLRRISQRVSYLAHRLIETVVEIHDRAWPKLLAYLLPRHQLSGSLEQDCKQAERLLLQWYPLPLLGELAAVQIRCKETEFDTSRRGFWLVHGRVRP